MNRPNILSNELDQVPKIGNRYREELNKSDLKDQIISAFETNDDFPMGENDFFIHESDKKVLERFFAHNKDLPMEQVTKMLKDMSTVSCEIQRVQKEKTGGWTEAIGPATPIDNINIGYVLTRNKEKVQGTIITYLTFTKINNNNPWPDVRISAKQIETPGEGAMLPKYVVFYKELSGEEFEKQHIKL